MTSMSSRTRIDLDDPRLLAYGRLIETQRRLHRLFDRSLQAEVGITIGVYEALLRLARAPEGHLTINELGEAMDLSSGGATRLVDRLVAENYVERVGCPSDRRVSWAAITDAGREKLEEATVLHVRDVEEHLVSKLGPGELDTLRGLLRSVRPGD